MLTKEETLVITQACVKAGVNGIYQAEAVTFASEHGKDVIMAMLRKVNAETNRRTGAKLQPTAKGSHLRKSMRDYATAKAAQQERWREHDEMRAEYNKSQERGYKPTTETIRGQLNALLDIGDISTQQWETGMRFLDGDRSQWSGNLGEVVGEEV